MSYSDIFHDYIKDIPMDIGRKFYPTPNISVEMIPIPERLVFSKFDYTFEAESRAREQFDKQNETITLETTSSTATSSTEGTTSPTSSEVIVSQHVRSVESGKRFGGLSHEVLVPCPVNSVPSIATKPLTPNTVSMLHSLHDFESVNNVFDDVEILALDDRKALQEVLMNTNSSNQSSSSSPILFNNSINNNPEKVASLPQMPKTTKEKGKDNEELRKRLLTKGYRQDIVEKALGSLPKNRLVHIEYYMKACRTVEKTGRSTVDNMLAFLINCSLTDKHEILKYSETCATLLKMGFDDERVFDTVSTERGDQNKAISRLLPSA